MNLTEKEQKELLGTKTEKDWYSICNKIKLRRNGQYPPFLARTILDLYQSKFKQNKEETH